MFISMLIWVSRSDEHLLDASLNNGGLVGSQGGYICGVTDKSLLEEGREPDNAELVGCRSTSHVCGFGLCRVGNAVSAGIVSWTIRSTGHAGETSGMCYRLQELVRSSVSCGKPSTLQDKQSAIDVLTIRESVRKTGCVRRWAPTGRQLEDGLTKDKGEAVECLHRRLRSGSYMLRCEERVM